MIESQPTEEHSSSQLAAAWRYISRKPLPPRRPTQFTTIETSFGRKFAPIAIGLIFVESFAVHFFIDQIASDTLRLALHIIMYALELYTAIWLLADCQLMRETGHEVTAEGIRVHLGLRGRAFLPWPNVIEVKAEAYTKPELALMKPEAKAAHRAAQALSVTITPGETPNVVVKLREPVEAQLVYGLRKKASTYRLYLDDPSGFVAACQAAAAS